MIKQLCYLVALLSFGMLTLTGGSQFSEVRSDGLKSLVGRIFTEPHASQKRYIQISNTSAPSPSPSAVKPAPESNVAKRKPIAGINVAAGKRVIARTGGITYPSWGNANDLVDYKTTTNYPQIGRWGNETNQGKGTFQVVDLGAVYSLNGVGYNIDWDGAFKNSLSFRVEVSTDNKTWRLASQIVHPYSATSGSNKLDIDVDIKSIAARYVKYWEPPDGEWNGWGTFHQLRAYSPKK